VDRLLALLGLVEGSSIGPRDAAAPGTIGLSRDPIVDAVAAVLISLAVEGPLALVVDDAQWATQPLFRALATLFDQVSTRALLVVVGRSDVLGHGWWDQLPALEVLPVAPLDLAASERLLRAYLGGADLDESTRETLLARAQGNPFFLAELLHLLVDRGLLRRDGDSWRLSGELPREMLPAGVHAVLAARIDGLDAAAKSALRDASVIGTRFTIDMLRALEPTVSPEALAASVRELIARGIVMRADDNDETRIYAFAHALARDVAYAGIPKAERARRHARVAIWARTDLSWSVGEVDALIAGQAEQAVALASEMRLDSDDVAWSARSAGLAALQRMGVSALGRDDNVRAERLLRRALDLVASDSSVETVDDLYVGHAAALVGMRRLDDAAAELSQPLDSSDPARRAAALVVLGDVQRRRGDTNAAAQSLVTALAAASEAGVDRVVGEALRQLGMIDFRLGRLTAAERRFGDALALAERVGDQRGQGWALQHLAWSATTRGDYSQAERMLTKAADVFTGLDDDGGLSWCAGTEAFVRLLQGRLRQARGLARSLLPLGQAMGDRWGVAACRAIAAFADAELGDITAALEDAAESSTEFEALDDRWGRSMALIAKGAALRGSKRHDEAIQELQQAVALSEAAVHPVTAALALGVLGYCRLDVGDAEGARGAAERAITTLTGMDLEPSALVGLHVLLAQALRGLGRLDEAITLLQESQACLDASLLFPRRQALAHLAGAMREAGDPTGALAVARQAFAVPAEDVRSRVVALRVLAQCLAECGDLPAAELSLRQAAALARATEQSSERAVTEAALMVLAGPRGAG
jgi:tetratricopeptide (TPR) repeat protein